MKASNMKRISLWRTHACVPCWDSHEHFERSCRLSVHTSAQDGAASSSKENALPQRSIVGTSTRAALARTIRRLTPCVLAISMVPNVIAAQCSIPMFAAARSFDAHGDSPWYVASADFNGDGKADVAVANQTSNTVSVLLGNGDATLQTAATYPVGAGPNVVAVGDFNGDGKPDLAVASAGCAPCKPGVLGGGTWVLMNNGDGTFRAAVNVIPSGTGTVAVADFNGDGKQDLLVAGFGSGSAQLLLGNGDGA